MSPEQNQIPDWALQDRQADLGRIRENLDLFWAAAAARGNVGRGAIVVDTTCQPDAGIASLAERPVGDQ